MSRDYLVRPGTTGQRLRDAAIHLAAPATAAAAVAILGRLALWAAVVMPLGPLLVGRLLAGGRVVGLEHRARAVDFNITVVLYGLGVYGLLQLGARVEALGVLVAVGVLLLLLLLLNWLLMSAVAANRARYGELFDPPWVPADTQGAGGRCPLSKISQVTTRAPSKEEMTWPPWNWRR